jgi:hypothetical protein
MLSIVTTNATNIADSVTNLATSVTGSLVGNPNRIPSEYLQLYCQLTTKE